MSDFIFISFFSFGLLCFYLMLRISGYKLLQINLITITLGSLVCFGYLGILPLYFHWDDYRVETGITDKKILSTMLLYSFLCIYFFILGVLITKKVIFSNSGFTKIYTQSNYENKITLLILTILGLVIVVTFIKYLTMIEDVALFVSFKEGPQAAAIARSNMSNNFPGKYHWYNLLLKNLGLFISLALFSMFLKKKSYYCFLFFIISFLYSAFITLMTTEKAPLIYYIFSLFIVYALIKMNGNISLKRAALLIITLLLVLSISHISFTNISNNSLLKALESIFSRAFSGSIAPAYFYLEYFPAFQDFTYGKTFPNPMGLFPYEPYPYTSELMNWKFPEHIELNIIGTMPTIFWGEIYVNFGPWLIPLGSFLFGSYIMVIESLIKKIQPTPILIACYTSLIMHFKNISITGFSEYIFDIRLLAIIVVFLVIIVTAQKGRLRLNTNSSH